jgi:hypothetical protein
LDIFEPEWVDTVIPGDDPTNWIFNEVVTISDEFYLQIHQNKKNELIIYECFPTFTNVHQVTCFDTSDGDPVKLDGPIISFAVG